MRPSSGPPQSQHPGARQGWRAHSRQRVGLLLVGAVAAILLLPAQPAQPANGEPPWLYPKTSREFDGVKLRTRGHIHDFCVVFDVECLQLSNTDKLRSEATAQSKAMHRLAIARGQLMPRPNGLGIERARLQWEVRLTNTSGRVDIVVDDPGPGATILEVKRKGTMSRDKVRDQLARYIDNARELGIDFDRNSELKDSGWGRQYEFNARMWCVWADQTQGDEYDGIVWFAPKGEAPDAYCPPAQRPLVEAVENRDDFTREAVARRKEDWGWVKAQAGQGESGDGSGDASNSYGGDGNGAMLLKGEVSLLTPDGQADVTVHGDMGDNDPANAETNFRWCADDGTDTTQPHAPARLDPGQDFTVEANGASVCDEGEDNAELRDGTYDVTWDDHDFTDEDGDGRYYDAESVWGCMHTDPGTWDAYLGTMDIAADGIGSADFTTPVYTSGEGEAAAVCLTHDDDTQGNMLPVEPTL